MKHAAHIKKAMATLEAKQAQLAVELHTIKLRQELVSKLMVDINVAVTELRVFLKDEFDEFQGVKNG